jgi:hypothetical protein
MTDIKVVSLFGGGVPTATHAPVDRDLFGSLQEVRGKVVFLEVTEWHEDSLLRMMARNSVSLVIDLRSRPVFSLPRYQHRRVVSYFHKHSIQYLELINLLYETPAGEKTMPHEIAHIASSHAERGLTICLYDTSTKERGWLDLIRALMNSGTNRFVELNPRALAGSQVANHNNR